jgi:hypothetical protein
VAAAPAASPDADTRTSPPPTPGGRPRRLRASSLIGLTFGFLRVISVARRTHRHAVYTCHCECGGTTTAYGHALASGLINACRECRERRRADGSPALPAGPGTASDRARGRDRAKVERDVVGLADLLAIVIRLHAQGRAGTTPLARELGCSAETARRLLRGREFLAALATACPAALATLEKRRKRFTECRATPRRAWRGTLQEVQECRDRGIDPAEWPEDFYGQGPLAAAPTNAMPGSEEKIVVLAARYARREAMHHPLDAGRSCPLAPDVPVPAEPGPAETREERRQRLLYGPW